MAWIWDHILKAKRFSPEVGMITKAFTKNPHSVEYRLNRDKINSKGDYLYI